MTFLHYSGLALAIFIGTNVSNKNETVTAPSIVTGKGFAVVELFTSEGCSSCPAADAEVEKIAAQNPLNVYVLGFHVDYWNRLGWKDAFSDAAYSDRQRDYARHFKLNGVYTPQVVVNGKTEFVGSDESKLQKAVANGLALEANHHINISNKIVGSAKVEVTYDFESAPGLVLNIALVQKESSTNVKRGENGGRKLHHINIVRDFKTIKKSLAKGATVLNVPSDLMPVHCEVIAYSQQQNNGEITAVTAASIK